MSAKAYTQFMDALNDWYEQTPKAPAWGNVDEVYSTCAAAARRAYEAK